MSSLPNLLISLLRATWSFTCIITASLPKSLRTFLVPSIDCCVLSLTIISLIDLLSSSTLTFWSTLRMGSFIVFIFFSMFFLSTNNSIASGFASLLIPVASNCLLAVPTSLKFCKIAVPSSLVIELFLISFLTLFSITPKDPSKSVRFIISLLKSLVVLKASAIFS